MDHPTTATAVTYTGIGGEEVIRISKRSVRAPGAGEILLRVRAAAVSPTDVLLRDPGRDGMALPITPGMDAAGVVEAVGPDVSRLRVGDEVMAAVWPSRPEGGAQATLVVLPAASAVSIPEGATFAEASTLPMNGLTALLALDLAELETGNILAVSGGAGFLASYTIAIAKQRGMIVVADAKAGEGDLVREYGADIVVERSDDFAGAVRRALPEGVHALLDTALLGEPALAAVRDGGVYLPVRQTQDVVAQRGIRVRRVFVGEVLGRTDWLEALRDLAVSGRIRMRVAGEFAPSQVGAAQRALLAGGLRGRPVLVFRDGSSKATIADRS